ncbi:MAG: RluA family pseudouridine synthase [Rhodocyclaceae bacterium]|nr:RluA family pseudouridine synthase [Rhodocyclaceae bacterium]MCA3076179.1 RluA family pseudouridine synthase [Rhodocyclaceae bacterium]MCA3089364.1 RluA family pseudouridine synthase [Rhodocyclaceae bacterium]MCA3092925.1 RluA family pseudouridine synthase [Rhodocyclaceae bacterium]MCA3096984.1 RluA family pseudouridine synthase [Rhodocyclaceae bacterium]
MRQQYSPSLPSPDSAPEHRPAHDSATAPQPLVIPVSSAGERIDQALAALLPEHSRSRLQQWIRDGRVLVDGRTVRSADKVWGGERLDVSPGTDPRQDAALPEAIALQVVHEDEAVIVLDKPPGLVVHPGSGNWTGTLLNALLHHHPPIEGLPRAGIVHRLDKDTSGLMMVAKTLVAHTALVRALAAREVERIYQAIVVGIPAPSGEVEQPIGRHPVNRVRMAVVAGGRPALTRFRLLEALAGAALVECRLATGRTHQIRVHMESLGHPVLGDPVYAPKAGRLAPALAAASTALDRQALHAVELAFAHPVTGAQLRFRSSLPADIRAALEALRAPA